MQTPVEDFFNFTVLCQSFKVVLRDSLQIFQCLLGGFFGHWWLYHISQIFSPAHVPDHFQKNIVC